MQMADTLFFPFQYTTYHPEMSASISGYKFTSEEVIISIYISKMSADADKVDVFTTANSPIYVLEMSADADESSGLFSSFISIYI